MTDLTHTHIAHRLNQRAEQTRQNERMEDMHHRALPLWYAVIAAALITVLWIATDDYRDVAAHHWETWRIRVENDIISAKLATCANEGTVPFNGGTLTCKFKKTKLVPL